MTNEKKFSQEDIDKMIAEAVMRAKAEQMFTSYGRVFFTESIAFIAQKVQMGALPQDVLDIGQGIFNQFMMNRTAPQQPAPRPDENEPAQDQQEPQ